MSFGGLEIKWCGFPPWQLAGLRGGIAALVVLLLVPEARRIGSWKVWVVSCALAGTTVCFIWSNKTTTAANAIHLQYTAPLWVLALPPLLLGERIKVRDLGLAAVFGFGMLFIFIGTPTATDLSPLIAAGNWIALLAGFFYGLLILGLRWLRGAQAVVACLE